VVTVTVPFTVSAPHEAEGGDHGSAWAERLNKGAPALWQSQDLWSGGIGDGDGECAWGGVARGAELLVVTVVVPRRKTLPLAGEEGHRPKPIDHIKPCDSAEAAIGTC